MWMLVAGGQKTHAKSNELQKYELGKEKVHELPCRLTFFLIRLIAWIPEPAEV